MSQKQTPAEGWIPSLNGLRALGVSMVIGGHLFYAHPELDSSPTAALHRRELEKIAAWHPTATRILAALLMYVPTFLGSRLLLAKFTVMLGPTLQAACAAVLIVSLVHYRNGIGFRVLNLNFVSYIGAISYSLYIWQMPFLAKPDTYGGTSEWFLAFPLDLMMIFVAAMTSYHLLERPLAGLRRRLHSHKRLQV